ncbi:MAG TPA: hypothetical protein VKA14_03170 [Gammaproteobacteria bacterium]|nr:hypothetical protein [Gammaproteobacteria bacterium]
MSDMTAFYISLAVIVAVSIGGIHLLGYLLRSKDGNDEHRKAH